MYSLRKWFLTLVFRIDTYKENVTAYLDLMLAPLIEAGVPFATTFGNHDNQANITHLEQIKHIQKIAPLAYTKACGTCGGEGGEANYYVPIYPKSCGEFRYAPPTPSLPYLCLRRTPLLLTAHAPALLLWFFDSRGGVSPASKPLPDWVDENVADWVEDISGTMQASWGEEHQALIFAHIAPSVRVLNFSCFLYSDSFCHPGPRNLMKDLQKTRNSTAEPGLNGECLRPSISPSSTGIMLTHLPQQLTLWVLGLSSPPSVPRVKTSSGGKL